MRPPPFLLGAALIFWGWQSELLWLGSLAAVLIELPVSVRARWQFSQSDLDRVWNLCVALFLGATVYVFVANDNLTAVGEFLRDSSASNRLATLNQSKRSLFQLLQWLPMMFLPIALAQAFQEQDRMDLSTFSWWLRRKRGDPHTATRFGRNGFNVSYPYFAFCLFSASAGNLRTIWFSVGLITLIVWGLWSFRSPSFRVRAWVTSLGLALLLAAGTGLGMLEMQKLLQRIDEALLSQWAGNRGFNANESQTRIGAIGRLKLSSRILFRLNPKAQAPPGVLRQASYNAFRAPFWTASRRDFEHVTPEANQTTWIVQPLRHASRSATISGFISGGEGVLAVPEGVARLENLPAMVLQTNFFGSIKVEDAPGFVEFESEYEPEKFLDTSPTDQDSEIPGQEVFVVRQVLDGLKLSGADPKTKVQRIEKFFADHFTYSTWQDAQHMPNATRTALGRFLLEHRTGHCEYFATATVLLLRAAGIPARYATGYVVDEKSGNQYVVRERHAHAWCIAWLNGAWRNVDTTPGTWSAAESARASLWQPIGDILSRVWFEFSRWRWGHAGWKRYLLWLIIPLLIFASARLLLQKQWKRIRKNSSAELPKVWPGFESGFYEIERALVQAGFVRQDGETATAWSLRLEESGVIAAGSLSQLVRWHYQLRFDPRGLSSKEKLHFDAAVREWLATWALVKKTAK